MQVLRFVKLHLSNLQHATLLASPEAIAGANAQVRKEEVHF
jgi:hypothetical protein